MKIKTINRSEESWTRERSQDVEKVYRNLDPSLHPMEKAVEYTRALKAAKLDRIFAKPFLGSLPHDDGISCLARNPKRLNSLLSGSSDGDIRLWDIPAQRCLRRLVGHSGQINGLAVSPDGECCVSAATDCTVKLWKVPFAPFDGGPVQQDSMPIMEFNGKFAFRAIDHHWERSQFATGGAAVDVWDHSRGEPISTFTWGADTITSVRFNPAEPDVFATTGSDRGIAIYDLRLNTPVRKVIMQTRANALSWNPMEALNFTVANEDCNLYSYDMRRLDTASCMHQDFVSSVMDVDYSPTGREFVAGGYDRSIRIFPAGGGHSREVYTGKRMQRVFAVRYSGDGSYVFSGSDDMNVRIWKANASEQLGTVLPRERHALAYSKALIERHKHLPEVKRIIRHRHVPKAIYKAAKLRRQMTDAERKKTQNRVAHSAPGSVELKPARKKKIVAELE